MLQDLLIALGVIPMLAIVWALVQKFWGSSFSELPGDQDVLALRETCGHCGEKDECFRRNENDFNQNQPECREELERQEKHHG